MVIHSEKKNNRGFTLIEMLVVVSVLGILVSIAGHHHTMVLRKAKDAAVMLELSSVRNAIHQFALDNMGRFPQTLEELKPVHLKNLPARWQGSSASGCYHYDPIEARVDLYDASGNELAGESDHSGKKYADY
ncbi:MAG: prepilin-type N-terminal cleavage/methylation domain-containing protein [Candidatus Riflebacteria bacterium]|nr:prepilin-type N-terminal cleavage/methylation domain-containing protein [Candidatus Riflebacteria bacterium]